MVDSSASPPSTSSDRPLASPLTTSTNGFSMSSTLPDPTEDLISSGHIHRTLVLCFDGTGDQFSSVNSNIVQFFSMLSKDDPAQQLVYYQAGIGTYTIPQIMTPLMAKLSMIIDMMLGNHLDAHVMGGYEFLMQNYQAGDKICIFGFSRGAYTARALAGMVHKVGLLPRCNHQQVPFAYKMYSQDDDLGWKQSTAFKKAFSINVDIEFVGVWDTVNSVGVIPHRLPFTAANDSIRYFRHALSLDERRVRFKANYWHRSTEEELLRGVKRGDMPSSSGRIRVPEAKASSPQVECNNSGPIIETDVVEVWFAGTHGDVGGGTVANDTPHSLPRISLRWMIKQCFLAKTGIIFHRSMMKTIGIDCETLLRQATNDPAVVVHHDGGPSVNEGQEDLADAVSPLHDQLVVSWAWWILEVIPQIFRFQKDDNTWVDRIIVNMGAGRRVPMQLKDGVKVHRTVKYRMEADKLPGGKYSPKAKLQVQPNWVD